MVFTTILPTQQQYSCYTTAVHPCSNLYYMLYREISLVCCKQDQSIEETENVCTPTYAIVVCHRPLLYYTPPNTYAFMHIRICWLSKRIKSNARKYIYESDMDDIVNVYSFTFCHVLLKKEVPSCWSVYIVDRVHIIYKPT